MKPEAPASATAYDATSYDALVLTGGRSSRMGRDKAELVFDGLTLLDHTLAGAAGALRRIIVGPHRRPGWTTVTESAPHRGPVAGLAAGIAALEGIQPSGSAATPDWLLVLACDHPRIEEAIAALLRLTGPLGSSTTSGDGPDGKVAVDDTGRPDYLLGCYRRSALLAALAKLDTVEDAAMRRLLAPLDLHMVSLGVGLAADVDDPAQARRFRIDVPPANPPPGSG